MNEVVGDWLGQVQHYFALYGYWFVFFVLFLENVMWLGAVIPGAVVLVVGGWMAQQGQGFPYLLTTIAFMATISGDTVSYLIGKRASRRLLQSKRWGKKLASISQRVGQEPALFVLCHFASYLRMFVPVTAGISAVPFRRWFPLDALGASLWVTSHVAAGYLLSLSGASSAGRIVAMAAVALLVLILVVRWLKRRYTEKERASRTSPPPVKSR